MTKCDGIHEPQALSVSFTHLYWVRALGFGYWGGATRGSCKRLLQASLASSRTCLWPSWSQSAVVPLSLCIWEVKNLQQGEEWDGRKTSMQTLRWARRKGGRQAGFPCSPRAGGRLSITGEQSLAVLVSSNKSFVLLPPLHAARGRSEPAVTWLLAGPKPRPH